MPIAFGLNGIIWAGPVSDCLGILLSVVFFLVELPKMGKAPVAAAQRAVSES